jgi:hypothetical protein
MGIGKKTNDRLDMQAAKKGIKRHRRDNARGAKRMAETYLPLNMRLLLLIHLKSSAIAMIVFSLIATPSSPFGDLVFSKSTPRRPPQPSWVLAMKIPR